jgi:hypothetical protein
LNSSQLDSNLAQFNFSLIRFKIKFDLAQLDPIELICSPSSTNPKSNRPVTAEQMGNVSPTMTSFMRFGAASPYIRAWLPYDENMQLCDEHRANYSFAFY